MIDGNDLAEVLNERPKKEPTVPSNDNVKDNKLDFFEEKTPGLFA